MSGVLSLAGNYMDHGKHPTLSCIKSRMPTLERSCMTAGCFRASNAGSAVTFLNAASNCSLCLTREVLFCS